MGLVFFLGFWAINRDRGWSQWSTLKSGPSARVKRPGKGRKLGGMEELVVHFREWTTSWDEKAGKWPETVVRGRASGPLCRVDH